MANISGLSLGVTLIGGVFLYSGVKGAGLSDTIHGFLKGQPAQGTSFTGGPTGTGASNGTGVVGLAQSQIGKPYVWDTPASATTANPPSFDCSGLTMWCYWQAGKVRMPHLAAGQYLLLAHRSLTQAQPGDLVFYAQGANIYHVAVYIGNMTVIEAPEPGVPVRTRTIHAGDQDLMPNVGIYPGGAANSEPNNAGPVNTASNKSLGQTMAAQYGWTGSEFTALDSLWTRESGWSNTALNSGSGAYGIAQALPATKYPAKGQASGGSDPATQIAWGLAYIKSRYGSPSVAWQHELSNGWY